MSDKKPQKIDIDQALAGGTPTDGGGSDDIEIIEVVGGEPEGVGEDRKDASAVAVQVESAKDASEAEAKSAALLDRLKRLQAEYENYRKRVERVRVEHREQANAKLVLEILPVLDSFERALKDRSTDAADEFSTGVQLIERQLREVLDRAGLELIQAAGDMFDPEIHEAVAATHDPAATPGKILDVFEQGYRFKGRLLRPARVRVAAAEDMKRRDNG
ncbi:MAG: nucleotide exchange factor GrpE [Acidobacteria bacterium]|nr:nucleotide exchange factor GrpE [Acidobacteriota bacterium]